MPWRYILEYRDRTLYIGHADGLERMRCHDAGVVDSCTAAKRPLKFMLAQEFEIRYEALAMERKLKGRSRAKKLADIAGDWSRASESAKGRHSHQRG